MDISDTEQILKNLFDQNYHSLVFTSFHIVKEYNQAKDIVQDVFVKVWQNFDKFEHHRNLKAYLIRAVKNSSLNYIRDTKPHSDLSVHNELIAQETDGIEEEEIKSEILESLHRAINSLPEHWKEAFILSKYDMLKYAEIASIMNISIKTVEKYISKALQHIRKELKHIISILILIALPISVLIVKVYECLIE